MADKGIESHVFERARLRRVDRVLTIVWRIVRLIRARRIQIVHSNGNSALLYASLAAKLTRTKLLWHLHDPQSNGGLRRWTLVHLLRWLAPDFIVFSSETCASSWLSLLNTPPAHSIVFPGVDAEQLESGVGHRGRHQLGIGPDAPLVLMLARLVPYKGHEDLLRSAPFVLRDVPAVKFVLCATAADPEGPEMQRLREIRHELELDLDEIVALAVSVPEQLRADLLAATSVFAHPARFEPFGLAILEAMALGKPVVAAASEGARFLLRDGLDGVLVPAGDPGALGAAISELLRNPDLRGKLGAAGKERAADFSNQAMVRRIEEIWGSLLGGEN
jgi:glycosyltransferase involved in cell wall biosynthesis